MVGFSAEYVRCGASTADEAVPLSLEKRYAFSAEKREIALASLKVSLKRKSVRETTLGNLAENSVYLSKCLSKTWCLSL